MKCPKCQKSDKTIKYGKCFQNGRQKVLCKRCHYVFYDGKFEENEEKVV